MKLKHKFNAVRTEVDNINFSSKLEASYYKMLKLCQQTGSIIFFLRQVPFDLPGKIKYLVDFQVFHANGNITFVDVKGIDTPVSKLKRKQVEEIYPVHIEVINKVKF